MPRQQHAATLSHTPVRERRDAAVAAPPSSAPSGSPFGATSSSGSTAERLLTSPATSSARSRTLFARLFRLKERSPAAPTPLLLQAQPPRSPALDGEEESKTEPGRARTDSPMMALFRSLNLRGKAALAQQDAAPAPRSADNGRSRRTRIPAAQAAGLVTSVATTVVAEGLLTKLVPQRYWHSRQAYFTLEETLGDGGGSGPPHVRFTLRQYRSPEPGAAPELLVAVMALSENDVVTDLRDERHVKFALELQLAVPPQYTELGGLTSPLATSRSPDSSTSGNLAGVGLHSLRLAASDAATHSRWLRALSACIAKLIVQSETHYPSDSCAWSAAVERMGSGLASPPRLPVRKGPIAPAAKIAPLSGDEVEPNGSNGSDYSSNNVREDERNVPAEEIRVARSDDGALETKARATQASSVAERAEQAGWAHDGLELDDTVVRAGEQRKRCGDEGCRSPEHDELGDNNALSDDDKSSSESDNQDQDAALGDATAEEQVLETFKNARAASGSRLGDQQLPRGAVGAASVGAPPFLVPVRPQLHSFNANGQVFTLDVRYQLLKPIGTGAYGAVIAVKDLAHGGESLAVKKITNIFEDLVDAKRILREVRLLHHFRHKNITRLLDLAPPLSRKHLDDMYIITELMETDLHQVIYSMQPMSDDHVKYFLYQMLCALQHIHSAGVLHRDMKPSNILLNSNCDLKICDFGLARGGLDSPGGRHKPPPPAELELTEYVVTRWYRAPEIMLNCLHYTTAIDVWAAGCIFAEMLLREPLFPGNDYLHQLKLIIKFLGTPKQEDIGFVKNAKALRFLTKLAISKPKKWRDVFAAGGATESEVSPEAIDLLSKMLLFNPDKRISVDAALRHPYLATFFDEDDLVASTRFDFGFDLPDDQLSKDALVDLLCEDIEHFHPRIPSSTAPLSRSSAVSRFFHMGMTASAS